MTTCRREQEIAEAMRAGHWPAAGGEDLRSHVAECPRCADFVRVKTAFAGMRAGDVGRARLEAPGLLLWRAQMRRRSAALERVARPMQQAYVFGLGILLAVLLGFGVMAVRRGVDLQGWVSAALASVWLDGEKLVLWGMLGSVAVLGGVVAFLAAERE